MTRFQTAVMRDETAFHKFVDTVAECRATAESDCSPLARLRSTGTFRDESAARRVLRLRVFLGQLQSVREERVLHGHHLRVALRRAARGELQEHVLQARLPHGVPFDC